MTRVPPRLASALEARYQIEAVIGHGGMAHVYRARDPRHERTVALKVLREELAASLGAARFLAEIRTTANLQHPHILPLFDSGEAEGFLFYVMPYVEGESLADRIAREKQLPVEDAVQIAGAVANALDHAHRHGVIHRDIKPANILLHEGQPLIADFGIALALEAAGGDRLTATGLSVGTPAYMSPEQIAGDSRIGPPSDVYALGCVLYEMLAGEPPYSAPTVEALVARIISGDHLPVLILRKAVPTNVAAVIGRSLESVPADRFRSAHEFAAALHDPAFREAQVEESLGARRPHRSPRGAFIGWAAAAAVAVAWAISVLSGGSPAAISRFAVDLPPGQQVTGLGLSPDGRTIFYAAEGLYRRTLEALDPEPIPQTEGARDLEVGPGGEWIAFVKARSGAELYDTLYKIRSSGGPAVKIAAHPYIRGIAWDSTGYLIIGSHEGGLWRVPVAGGDLQQLTNAERAAPHRFPHVLPRERGILFHIFGSGAADQVAVLPQGSKEWRALTSGRDPVFVPPGHLVFYRHGGLGEGSLWAAPFDLDRLELLAEPVPLGTDVMWQGRALKSSSLDGSLYYVEPAPLSPKPLIWVDRHGLEEELNVLANPVAEESSLRLSADGQLLLQLRDTRLWVHDFQRGFSERLTGETVAEWSGLWSKDGRDVVFMSRRGGPFDIYRIPLRGPKRIEALGTDGGAPQDWTVDGKGLLYVKDGLRRWSLEDRDSELLLDEPVRRARLSPDGRWIAYESTVDGSTWIDVRPYPNVSSDRWRIPGENAKDVKWSHDGSKLYFLQNGAIMVVGVRQSRQMPFESPRLLFKGPYAEYDAAPDGRLLAIREPEQRDSLASSRIIVIQNWVTELRRLSAF